MDAPLNSTPANTLAPDARLTRLEDAGSDFPFYNGAPVSLSGWQWLIVMVAVGLGYTALVLPIAWPGGTFGVIIPTVLFPLIPMMALAYIAPCHWRVIFGKVGFREVKLMIGFALLNVVVTMIVGTIVRSLVTVASNAAATQLIEVSTADRVAFFIKTLPQLFGEEVITLLPFLALMYLFSHRFSMSRRTAIIGAWVISSIIFGLLHLPAYDWNLVQCLVIIGTARMVLTLPWILTKNIWVSTGAHIVNDWLLFSVTLIGASLAAKA
jgi:membrane protease YdiL (CAAX protease family)